MPKQPETVFKEKVQADCDTLVNVWYFKTQERAIRGILDIIMCLNGWFIAIELKTESGDTEPLQDYNIFKIQKKGRGIAFVATPSTWQKQFEKLQFIDKLTPILPIPLF